MFSALLKTVLVATLALDATPANAADHGIPSHTAAAQVASSQAAPARRF